MNRTAITIKAYTYIQSCVFGAVAVAVVVVVVVVATAISAGATFAITIAASVEPQSQHVRHLFIVCIAIAQRFATNI